MSHIAFNAANCDSLCINTGLVLEQGFNQGFGYPIHHNFEPGSITRKNRLNPAYVKGAPLANRESFRVSFMQTDTVQGTDRGNLFTMNHFGFNVEVLSGIAGYNLTPAQFFFI